MNVNEDLIAKALELKPNDKLFLIEALVESLDKTDKYIEEGIPSGSRVNILPNDLKIKLANMVIANERLLYVKRTK